MTKDIFLNIKRIYKTIHSVFLRNEVKGRFLVKNKKYKYKRTIFLYLHLYSTPPPPTRTNMLIHILHTLHRLKQRQSYI